MSDTWAQERKHKLKRVIREGGRGSGFEVGQGGLEAHWNWKGRLHSNTGGPGGFNQAGRSGGIVCWLGAGPGDSAAGGIKDYLLLRGRGVHSRLR